MENNMKNHKPLLVIDGNFFANRCIGILNQGNSKNYLNTDIEMEAYKNAFKYQLYTMWETYSKYFDNFIIVKDGYSWRKDFKFKPYYLINIPESELCIGYKEQRIKVKEKSEINYVNLNKTFNDLMNEFIESNINVSYSDRLEGDDLIWMITDKTTEMKIDTCIFATDRDLTQLLNEYTCMFSCIRSKQHPSGVFFLSQESYDKMTQKQTMLSKLTGDIDPRQEYFQNLISSNIYDTNDLTNRILDCGISISEPNKTILMKIICGDKSDNIFPLFRWTKGGRNYSVTEKMVYNILSATTPLTIDNKIYGMFLNDESLLKDIISTLAIFCNVNITPELNIFEHFQHNKRIIEINKNNIPNEYIESAHIPDIENLSIETLESLKKKLKIDNMPIIDDTQVNFLKNSIPENF